MKVTLSKSIGESCNETKVLENLSANRLMKLRFSSSIGESFNEADVL